jgi:hypothetical protein
MGVFSRVFIVATIKLVRWYCVVLATIGTVLDCFNIFSDHGKSRR